MLLNSLYLLCTLNSLAYIQSLIYIYYICFIYRFVQQVPNCKSFKSFVHLICVAEYKVSLELIGELFSSDGFVKKFENHWVRAIGYLAYVFPDFFFFSRDNIMIRSEPNMIFFPPKKNLHQ